jgi:hypothetical protein
MFVFPLIYLSSFIASVYQLFKGKTENVLLFILFGLPIYITSLSVAYMYGVGKGIIVLQAFKELVVLIAISTLVINLKKKLRLHFIDKLVLAYFFYMLAYVFLPLGSYGLYDKLLAFKGISFFPFVYFTGRLIDFNKFSLNKYFNYICFIAIAAAVVLLFEVITYTHFQTYSGYTDYMFYFFDQEQSGNFGLSWTFEIENGLKRFASFFSNPLENAAATLVSLSVLIAMATTNNYKLKIDKIIAITFFCSLFTVVFALSRASFASYFMMLYAYAIITKKKNILKVFHYGALIVIAIAVAWINQDLYDFIMNTIDFSNSSSLSHLVQWVEGIEAMINSPLGLGLGESGRVSSFLGFNIGGENQLIIIGVQGGVIAMLLYAFIYGSLIVVAAKTFNNSKGKLRKLAVVILMIKVGLIIPLLTAEVESYVYIGYITWFFAGLLVNMIAAKQKFIIHQQEAITV